MGAAFQRGFSTGLKQYILEQQSSNLWAQQGVLTDIQSIKKQMADFYHSPIVDGEGNAATYLKLRQSLESKVKELSTLQDEYVKLAKIKIEIVVDIEPQDKTAKDPNAQNHYYINSDRSKYEAFEKVGLNIQPVTGATDASMKSDGTPVSTGHHSSFVKKPSDLPKP